MEQPLDALIVGAGFAGIHLLNKLRKLGFSVKLYEAGGGLGGTWWWNRYPGARVDSETPIYQLSEDKEVWESWEWSSRFPARDEILRYFEHADQVLGLSKDVMLNTRVRSAQFDGNKNTWVVKTDTGLTTTAKHLFLCAGFAAKRYTPPFTGLDKFKGQWYHSGFWPEEGVDLRGKRVAVVGTGASGVQIVQEIGPHVAHLTVYQRTPNLALPMRQVYKSDNNPKQDGLWTFPDKTEYPAILKGLRDTFAAVIVASFAPKKFEDTPLTEQRAFFERLWAYGGFAFWLENFLDIFHNQEANDTAYAFWAEKTRDRINDPVKKDILAPLVQPHAFGTKRPSLEISYYETFNLPHVEIINVKDSPIIEVTEGGIRTEKEGVVPFDVIVFATGFDTHTGGILDIQIINEEGLSLQDKWSQGVRTYLGMVSIEFPNLFWVYGPQAPTAFANGPTCAEVQGNWLIDLLVKMQSNQETRVEATAESEEEWSKHVKELWDVSLFSGSDSWYQGANIPGKRREPLNYCAGLPAYIQILEECKGKNYDGFNFSRD